MDKLKRHKEKIIFGVLCCSLILASACTFLFFSDYGRLHFRGSLPGPHGWRSSHAHRPPGIEDVDRIQPWMTFSFVNKVFGLPPEYLKEMLLISDARYPNITIESAAKSGGTTPDKLLISLKAILRNRLDISPEKSTTQ